MLQNADNTYVKVEYKTSTNTSEMDDLMIEMNIFARHILMSLT